MLLDQKNKVRWNSKNKKWYVEKGYVFTFMGDAFYVDIKDLKLGSHEEILIECDYCHKQFKREYKTYNQMMKKSKIKKDCYDNCDVFKVSESWSLKDESEINEITKKRKETYIEKYDVDNPMKNKEIQQKAEQTNIERYGSKSPMHNEEVMERYRQNMIKSYGVPYNGLREDIKEELNKKRVKTLYENGTAPKSKEQVYINEIIGGEMNYPMGTISMDIAFPEDKIYVEYDGSGHDLQVQYKKINQEEFIKIEAKRYYFLKSKGWKQIQIISKKDYLPNKDKITHIIEICKEQLNQHENNWIKVDIDNKKIYTKTGTFEFDFGKLKKLRPKKTQSAS